MSNKKIYYNLLHFLPEKEQTILFKASEKLFEIYNDSSVAKRKALELYQDLNLPTEEIFNIALDRIIKNHEPQEYVVGFTYFDDMKLYIESPILIPRTETEYLCVEIISNLIKKPSLILDIGTGSGCIALWLAKKYQDAFIDALDINKKALDLATKNALHHKIKNINIFYSNLFSEVKKSYDFIVSNPPYISKEDYEMLDPFVKKWEDPLALTDFYDGTIIIKNIIKNASSFLNNDGFLMIELDPKNSEKIIEYATLTNFYKNITIHKDMSSKNRFLVLQKYNLS